MLAVDLIQDALCCLPSVVVCFSLVCAKVGGVLNFNSTRFYYFKPFSCLGILLLVDLRLLIKLFHACCNLPISYPIFLDKLICLC